MELNCVTSELDYTLEQGAGFFQAYSFTQAESDEIVEFIREQWLERIKEVNPKAWKYFSEIALYDYHKLSHLLDHGSTWIKSARMFSKSVANKIRKMSLIQKIESEYGPIIIVDQEDIGHEEFDWRLVRPNEPLDVGPLHADAWFAELGHGYKSSKDHKAVKVWVSLYSEPGLSGLQVVPYSQKKEWRYHGELRGSFVKPKIDEDEEALGPVLLNTKMGNAVIFHDRLLHRGAINRGSKTRVSMEFMIFVKRASA